ncbi:hypothetical protein KsCSTR_48030 [Candidatus Kuenenia stuttgartiensis]|uniref:Uncharacterized protein n=1 Tax=Kuenenia stuttgartiensis TaxID=174633 RepID=Q1PVT5_KUEST|nr:hypothetical protein KsCSTR_48030 [Candidatus Kuenenia stuttgartiensis]CAJ71337.1 unknown protein [Candidatus Kuenenia stuttgartiensis]
MQGWYRHSCLYSAQAKCATRLNTNGFCLLGKRQNVLAAGGLSSLPGNLRDVCSVDALLQSPG